MVTVIKEPGIRRRTTKCKTCGAKLKYEKNDIEESTSYSGFEITAIKCPCCGMYTSVRRWRK